MYNLQSLIIRTPLSVSQVAATTTGSATDISPSAAIGKRASKIVVVVSGVSGTSPVFPLSLAECDTTNGTYTAVSGLTIADITTNGVTEYHAMIAKRYVIATVGAVTGTSPKANISVLVQTQLRSA